MRKALGERMMGASWNLPMLFAPSAARSTNAPTAGETPVYGVDASVWPRCDAETSPQRGYYYHPSRHSAGKPIVA
jgi:hypothetical protein